MAAGRREVLVLLTVAVGLTVARLRPAAVEPDAYPREAAVLDVCRTTVRDVQPFVLIVFAFDADPSDGFLKRLHDTVGASIVLADGTEERVDVQVALILADGPDAVTDAIDGGQIMWDQMSHYIWLMRPGRMTRSRARTLFRAAWRKHSVVNVVILHASVAYTYDPFKDVLREHAVDPDELREVARYKMADLNGYPVRICMFPAGLNAVKQPDGTYKGTDGIVASTLAERMNFTAIYNEPTDGRKYGWAEMNSESNFTYTGLLGDLVYKNADMAFNGAFLQAYQSNNSIRYTYPVMFDELCFIVPNAQQMSQWRAVFTAFDAWLWCFLAAAFFVSLGAWAFIKRTNNTPYSLFLLAINLFRVFLMIPLNRVPNNVPERVMVVSTVLFGFIMATSLQAVMVKYLSYPMYERNVATVQELYDTGMPVKSASTNIVLLFHTDDNPLFVKMSDRFIIVDKSYNILDEVAYQRTTAAMGRKNDLVEIISSSYVKNNEVLLHIVDNCPRSFYISYLVRRDVPFMNVINRIVTTFVESGIVKSCFMHVKPFRPMTDYHHQKNPHQVFGMKNVVIAFMCLQIGLTVGAVAFVAELVYFRKIARPEIAPTVRYPRNQSFIRRF